MVSRGTRSRQISENNTVEYGSSVSSVERVGMVNCRSESLSSIAHLWNGSGTDDEGPRPDEDKGVPTYSGLPEATQFPQPFAPDSPNRGCSDSQKSSSELRRASGGWPIRDWGTLNVLYHHERTVNGCGGKNSSQFSLALKKGGRSFDESYLPALTKSPKRF